jgi:tetratricopeptide (TPR) repeat protein
MTDAKKPPNPPGAGKIGTPGTIGKALGGDLEFEPDALLDALMDEDLPPQLPSDAPLEEEDSRDSFGSYPDDEVTLVGSREAIESGLIASRPAADLKPPQRPGVAPRPALPPAAGSPAARDATAPGPPPVPRPTSSARHQTLVGPPRPEPSRGPAFVPKPRPSDEPSRAAQPVAPAHTSPLTTRAPAATIPDLGETPATPSLPRSEAPDEDRGSLSDEEIAALEELEAIPSIPPPEATVRPSSPSDMPTGMPPSMPPSVVPTAPPSKAPTPAPRAAAPSPLPSTPTAAPKPPAPITSAPPTAVPRPQVAAAAPPRPVAPAPSPAAFSSAGPPRPGVSRPTPPPSLAPRASSLPPPSVRRIVGDEHPPLPRRGQPDEWRLRAEWMEGEARAASDPAARARALVAASELWAIAGNGEQARRVAQDAATLGRTAVAGRQLRWLSAADGDWKAVAGTLELELRGSPTPEARAHAAYLAAEIQRLCLTDPAAAEQRLELARSADESDVRPLVSRLVEVLAKSAGAEGLDGVDAELFPGLARAVAGSAQLRAGTGDGSGSGAATAFAVARRALLAGDVTRAASALSEIETVPGLGDGANWLAASLLAHSKDTRTAAMDRLVRELDGDGRALAQRALAARALEQGDADRLQKALEQGDETFALGDRIALGTLTGVEGGAIESLAAEPGAENLGPLLAAALAVASRPTPEGGAQSARAYAALGRSLRGVSPNGLGSELLEAARHFAEHAASDPFARLLTMELDLRARNAARLAESVGALPGGADDERSLRHRELSRALVLELARDQDAARETYLSVLDRTPSFEAALRAVLPSLSPAEQSAALDTLAEAASDPSHAALASIESALRAGTDDTDALDERLRRAVAHDPSLPFPYRIAELSARRNGDAKRLIEWLRARREASSDDTERALDQVREALLVADTDPVAAAELLEAAIATHPSDVGLRELHERVSPGASANRAEWREAAAEQASPTTRQSLLLQAAFEHERAGERARAARAARLAADISDNPVALLTAQRLAPGTPEAAPVAEALLAQAKAASDPVAQRELYEQLSELDAERGDPASALLWQRAILDGSPDHLPALRRLEQAYLTGAREEDLEPVAAALARALKDAEGVAHARLALRLKLRAGDWSSGRELAELALERDPNSFWALRALAAYARAADQPDQLLEVHRRLFELVDQPLDKATIALRAAEAAARLSRFEEAQKLLEAAVELWPDHIVALTTLAEVLEAVRDYRGAAKAMEVVAESSVLDANRVGAWHQAATLWLDKVEDVDRGRAALEQAVLLDPGHEDAIARLQQLLITSGDRQALAQLLERRIARAADAEERVALEVQRGRLLADVGERAAAKAALSAALGENPDHSEALAALAELCESEGDWIGTEQALIRLVRHAPDPKRQAEIYRKLGELYDTDLPNPERAELAYQEVLKREPDDAATVGRLVQVYTAMNNTAAALGLQTALLERASTREDKRDRTLALAELHALLGQKKEADGVLERARKEWPQDTRVLRALVENHRRAGEHKPAQMLLDRAANDARRALATGRFDVSFFEVLGTVADLRGSADAALVAEATIAALQGKPFAVHGAGVAVADPELDTLLAPELVTPALRALLLRAGDVLDRAYALDPKPLRAAPLPPTSAEFVRQVEDTAAAFGIPEIEILVSPVLGPTCLAVSGHPARLIYGSALFERGDDAMRFFLLIRALKLVRTRAATLARTAPIELGPTLAGFLSTLAPSYKPEGLDAKKLAEAQRRVREAVTRPFDSEVGLLALEVVGSIGNRASQLATALNQWASRAALLSLGNPLSAMRALSLAGGQDLPDTDVERLKFIVRHAEARDVAVFSTSDAYIEARARLGIQG